MNLRQEIKNINNNENEDESYVLTLKGIIYSYFLNNTDNLNPETLYDIIEEYAKKITKKKETPAIVFENTGGSFIGIEKINED